jgi:hypothetical protein
MAKRDDHDRDREDVEDAEEAAEAEEAEEAEADEAEAEEAAKAEDVEKADSEAGDAEPPEDEEAQAPEKPKPKPKITGLTLTLCILNVAAVIGFVVMLVLDYGKHQVYTYAAFQYEFQFAGLGTKEDPAGVTAGVETLPRQKLTPEALKAAYSSRGGASVSEPFAPVEDGLRYHLYGESEQLKELLKDLGNPVGNIEEEMARIKGGLFNQIESVAKELSQSMEKAADAAKKARIAMLLYPLCFNPMQVEKLETKIKKAKGNEVTALLEDAVQRRILADILLPVEMFRPGESEVNKLAILEKAADKDEVPLNTLVELMRSRLDEAAAAKYDAKVHYGKDWEGVARWTPEKRQNAAFLLVSLAYAHKHLPGKKDDEQLLDPKGRERAQRISGLFDFTQACVNYNDAVQKLEQRVIDAIALDRDGFFVQAGARSDSFADRHAAAIQQIRLVQLQIRQAEERVKDLQGQIDRAKKLVEDRTAQKAETEERINQERKITAKRAEELRVLQQQLYRALAQLADAADINARLEADIRKLSGVKGREP